MKKTTFIFLMAIAAICFTTTSCSNDIDDVPGIERQGTISLMAKKDMPDWLSEKITELEKDAPPCPFIRCINASGSHRPSIIFTGISLHASFVPLFMPTAQR